MAQAASGDTILIGPGFYYEHIDAAGKALTFVGRDGRDSTILDGSRPYSGEGGSIIYTYNRPGPIRVAGLTLQHGQGSDTGNHYHRFGGAIHINGGIDPGDLYAEDCAFLSNDVVGGYQGGAIGVHGTGEIRIERCVFRENGERLQGATMFIGGGTVAILGCEVDFGAMYFDYGIELFHVGRARIEDCVITGRPTGEEPSGIYFCGYICEMRGNRIVNDGTSGVVMISIGTCGATTAFTFENNLVWLTKAPPPGWARAVYGGSSGSAVYRHNTFIRDGLYHDDLENDPVLMEGNIFVDGAVDVVAPPGGCVCCNDFWGVTPSIWQGVHAENNISSDPMFCDPEEGDFTISRRSPCSGDSVPEGCQAMGAFPAACDQLPVKTMTWGSLKGLFGR